MTYTIVVRAVDKDDNVRKWVVDKDGTHPVVIDAVLSFKSDGKQTLVSIHAYKYVTIED